MIVTYTIKQFYFRRMLGHIICADPAAADISSMLPYVLHAVSLTMVINVTNPLLISTPIVDPRSVI